MALLDTYCSDKGTFWQSKHHYATAYHTIFVHMRERVRSVLEVGIGEDTAPSVAAWLNYFPHAHIYPIDIKTEREVQERARAGGATERLVKHQAQFGCEYNKSMWNDPRVHLTLNTDASDPEQLRRVKLPPTLDVIIDDGSHKFLDQQRTLHTLWPRLTKGGIYIVEDVLVGALPWSQEHAQQVPTNNSGCGHECFFPQRLDDHPFMFDRFGYAGRASASTRLADETKALFRGNDWFWVVTGVHKGGGLDCSLVLRKTGPPLDLAGFEMQPAALSSAAALEDAWSALEAARTQHAELRQRQDHLAAEVRARSKVESLPESSDHRHVCGSCAAQLSNTWIMLIVSAALNVLQFGMRARVTRSR